MCGCFSSAPYRGPGLQPRHVPWLGIELSTLWFAACAQSTKLHQSGKFICIFKNVVRFLRQVLPIYFLLLFPKQFKLFADSHAASDQLDSWASSSHSQAANKIHIWTVLYKPVWLISCRYLCDLKVFIVFIVAIH